MDPLAVSVVMPAYNEAVNLPVVLSELRDVLDGRAPRALRFAETGTLFELRGEFDHVREAGSDGGDGRKQNRDDPVETGFVRRQEDVASKQEHRSMRHVEDPRGAEDQSETSRRQGVERARLDAGEK